MRKCKLKGESECLGCCQGEAKAENVDLCEPHANLEDWDGSLSRTLSQPKSDTGSRCPSLSVFQL